MLDLVSSRGAFVVYQKKRNLSGCSLKMVDLCNTICYTQIKVDKCRTKYLDCNQSGGAYEKKEYYFTAK